MEAFVPAFVPFTFHWYEGEEPPFVGAAVKITLVPLHTAPVGFALIVTETGKVAFTDSNIEFEVAGEPLAQVAFEVRTQVILSLLIGV